MLAKLSWLSTRLITERPAVRVRPRAPHGAIAQLGERLPCKQEAAGSIPAGSTTYCRVEYWQLTGLIRRSMSVRIRPLQPYGSLAQLVERPAVNRRVAGSSPARAAIYIRIAQLGERVPYKHEVAGSIPAADTICGIGGIGRHIWFKPRWGNPCGFEARVPHHIAA